MGKICIIGPRSSGKTSYLAALAYKPEKAPWKNNNFLQVQAFNDDARELADKAESIISEGASLEPTSTKVRTIHDLPVYSLNIKVKNGFRKEDINLAVIDYPGEIFDELEFGSKNPLHQEFLGECLSKDVEGCLILLTEWKQGTDKTYSRVLKRFVELMGIYDRADNLRLAVAMSKCERGELWPGRIDPKIDLFDVHFPKSTSLLKEKVPQQNLNFFAISTFGVLSPKNPRPNRTEEWGTDGRNSVLREAEVWRPYNLISPLYWLSTGKKMNYDA